MNINILLMINKFFINITFIKRMFNKKKNTWQLEKSLNMKYKVINISNNVIEFVFIVQNISLDLLLFGIIFNIIINSNEYNMLGSNTKIIFMTGLTEGSWITIGSTFNVDKNISKIDFENHYLQSLKSLEDKHYFIYNFSFLVIKVFTPSINN